MSRKRLTRTVAAIPVVKGFRIIGNLKRKDQVTLNIEEWEAIRLMDYCQLKQEEAAIRMNVSRPTVTRIYEQARIKIAKSLTEGIHLVIAGGSYETELQNQ